MCTFSPWNPVWAVTAKRCGTTPGAVWAIVAAIREDDGMLAVLKPHDRVRVLAQLGIRVQVVALIVAALEEGGIVVDGRISEGWLELDLVRPSDSLKTDLTTFKTGSDQERRLRRAEINRRYYLKRKAKLASSAFVEPPEIKTFKTAPAGLPIEEERDISGSSQEHAQAQTGEPERVTKRRALLTRVTAAAPQMLEARQAIWFSEQMTPERVERFLAHGSGALFPQLRGMMELLITRTEWRGAPMGVPAKPPDPKQPSLRLPFEGGLRPIDPKAVLGGIADPGLQEALSGLGRAIGS